MNPESAAWLTFIGQPARSPEARQHREYAAMRKVLRDQMTQLLDENRDSLARRAALALTKRAIMDETLRDEVEKMRACLDNLLDNLFEQFKFDQMEGR